VVTKKIEFTIIGEQITAIWEQITCVQTVNVIGLKTALTM
jgi:hypothetical protein